jgi:hypothetical protein
MRGFKYLFLALTASALALAAIPASAGVAVKTTRVSVNSTGASGNPCSGCSSNLPISISATGRFVAFSDNAPNLVEGDRNFRYDIFVRDRVRGETTRVSVGSAGGEGNDDSAFPSISANGRFVAFLSFASNLVGGDRNHRPDVFVRDRKRGQTTRVGVSSTGAEANDGSIWGRDDAGERQLRRGGADSRQRRRRAGDHPRALRQRALRRLLLRFTRTWSRTTTTAPMTSSSATESGARRPGSASAPPGRRQMPAASFIPRSPPTGASSPSRLTPRIWSPATQITPKTSSSATESGA